MKGEEGIEGKTFLVTGGLGFVGAALCLKLIQYGASQVRSLDIRSSSTWSSQLSQAGVVFILGIFSLNLWLICYTSSVSK